jgi:hypothetical protein
MALPASKTICTWPVKSGAWRRGRNVVAVARKRGLPCLKGQTNSDGKRCRYAKSEQQAIEGWKAWSIGLRCAG